MTTEIKKLTTVTEMLGSLTLIRQLTPDVSNEAYENMLKEMVPHNYYQVGLYEGEKLVAISGYWINTKIYCGKYLEIDNFVVDEAYRSQKLGNRLVEWMTTEAKTLGCKAILLDAYVENFPAHRFYYRQGFIARGFHYLKWI